MDYEKKYKQLHQFINDLYPHMSEYCKEKVDGFFPELKESEDEKVRKALIELVRMVDKNPIGQIFGYGDIKYSNMIAWLEKQSEQKSIVSNDEIPTNIIVKKEEILIGVKKCVALSIMEFIDNNTVGMCLSNMECKDLEDAVVDSDWSKVYHYMKKKLEKQCEQKPTWSEKDEIGLDGAMWAIKRARGIARDESDMGNLLYAERFLKSIKERMKGE